MAGANAQLANVHERQDTGPEQQEHEPPVSSPSPVHDETFIPEKFTYLEDTFVHEPSAMTEKRRMMCDAVVTS